MIRIKASILPHLGILRIQTQRVSIYSFYLKRLNSTKIVDWRRKKVDIEDWVQNSLHEPIDLPIVETTHSKKQNAGIRKRIQEVPPISLVTEEEYALSWHPKFKIADGSITNLVVSMIQNDGKAFPLRQLIQLITSLKSKRRYYEIDIIYAAYRSHISILNQFDKTPELEQRFLEMIIGAEAYLGNYELCESLFSDYIKYCNVKPHIISIGLRSFIENGNLQLAKEFFIQALKNPDTFPMTNNELFIFLRDLSKSDDFSSMKFVFNLWLTEKFKEKSGSDEYVPNYKTLSLLHRTYKLHQDESGLQAFLSNDVVENTGYKESTLCKITDFCQDLRDCSALDAQENGKEMIEKFSLELKEQPLERRAFYLSILKTCVSLNDVSGLRYVMRMIQKDKDIPLNEAFHMTIAQHFVKRGLIDHLIEYYASVVRKQSPRRLRLRIGYIQQLWDCALITYPILTREITNELKILLNKEQYIRKFPHINLFLLQTNRMSTKKCMGGYETYKSRLSKTEFERLRTLRRQLSIGDVAGAKSTILQNIRQGICPRFDFYFSALSACLDRKLPSLAKTLDDSCSSSFHKMPLKVSIIWLKYEIKSKYEKITAEMETPSVSRIQPIKDQLIEYKRTHHGSMNFQNHLQLAQLSIYIRDYKEALSLIEESYGLIDYQNKQQWMMYYMTALKVYARLYRASEFCDLLREWNNNSNAKWVSHGCIRQIKAFSKLFFKRREQLVIREECEESQINTLNEISAQIDLLVKKYANYKFDGLNVMKRLTFFIKRWVEQEIDDLSNNEIDHRKK